MQPPTIAEQVQYYYVTSIVVLAFANLLRWHDNDVGHIQKRLHSLYYLDTWHLHGIFGDWRWRQQNVTSKSEEQ